MSVLGNRVLRTEDERMLTKGARYVADLRLEDRAVACFVRSTVAHGRLLGIHADDARAQPGVLGVFTAADLDLPDLPPIPVVNQLMGRPALARDTVRFVGEPVAAVVAETAAAAADAVEYVVVDIEPLPAVVSVWAAAEADASSVGDSRPDDPAAVSPSAAASPGLVHESAGTNLAFELPATGTASGGLDFSECDVTVEVSMVSQRLAAVPLEPRSAAAEWSADGSRLTCYATTQAPHRVRDALAHLCSLDPEAVRVIVPDVGGGFGAKGQPTPEELLVAVLSRQVGRPVVWTESRAENLTSSVHGRAQHHRLRLGGTRTGRLTHCELDVVQDAGAYPIIGAFLPTLTSAVFTGGYDIAAASIRGRSYVTNTAPIAAYRGAGRPDVAFALERAVDRFAAQVGMDPTEVRRMNLVTPDQFPFEAPSGSTYDSGDYEAALDTALDAAGYDALRAEQSRRRADRDPVLLGVGVASYVESTSMGPSELGEIELAADGSLVVRTGATAFGQGHATCWAMIASEATGVPMDRIQVVSGDTAEISSSGLTAASRSAQLAGSAVLTAARKLVELARGRAAALLEAAEADLVLDTGSGAFHVVGSPQPRIDWPEIAAEAARAGESPLEAASDLVQAGSTYAFGCHVAAVEVDSRTGETVLRSLTACDDAGTLINPLIAEGQIHGGIAQGAAQVLLEDMVYDADGNPLATNLVDYPAISAPDLPSFNLVAMQTPTPLNPLGAKGIGESGTTGAGAAIHNAVHDAVAHLGIDHIDMPATPQRIWQALSQAQPR